ncbi:MAG: chorismate synthase [Chloroflexota bacterium]|nr:MAG: chorismate synthase [Chloroflexota bacterium]
MRFLTAGESHGPALSCIVEGLPAGLPISIEQINHDLYRRQTGYGAGARMKIERDTVQITGGIVNGVTIGAPVGMLVENLDWKNWQNKITPPQTIPRPGHADLAGATKYDLSDLRMVGERASARETAMRVAAGSLARQLLAQFNISVGSYVTEIGGEIAELATIPYEERFARAEASDVRVYDEASAEKIRQRIYAIMQQKETGGGVIETVALNLPVGLGSHVHWDRKLDGRLAQALMSIHSVKGVEIGNAFENARKLGTQAQDEIFLSPLPEGEGQGVRVTRDTNRAGGLEGGITNGEPLVIRAAFKPIATTLTPTHSIDVTTREPAMMIYQRSDLVHIPRACVITEAMVCLVLADAMLEKFGGDSLREMQAHFHAWNPTLPEMR